MPSSHMSVSDAIEPLHEDIKNLRDDIRAIERRLEQLAQQCNVILNEIVADRNVSVEDTQPQLARAPTTAWPWSVPGNY